MKKIIFIVGPTAVGKTDIAFRLAKEINGEIISCDAMQVYKEINIASNKPPAFMLKGIPHHLMNIISIEEDFDVARFNQLVQEAIKEIHKKNRAPIIVGGSGMYMQILLDGIFEAKGKRDDSLREQLKQEAQEKGTQFLYDVLQKKDPQAALKIHPNDLRRIIRALEVIVSEKESFSSLQRKRQGLWGKYTIPIFGLTRERKELYQRIESRVEKMFKEGIVEEIKNLRLVQWSPTADRIIGVREIQGYLRGEYDMERAKYLMKLNTRHLAKKQLTWFRKEKRIHWFVMNFNETNESVVEKIMKEALKEEQYV